MLSRRKARAGIASPGLAHAFRHACASHMLAGGAPLPAVKRMLGHARLDTTARYTHVMKEALAKVHAAAHPKAKEAE
jgi:site-specific recombinase XerD